MREDFAALVLTHGRPNKQLTLGALDRAGYTGRVYLVVDDQDPCLDEYLKMYGGKVVVFSKEEVAAYTDDADNSGDLRGVVYARNACWKIARDLGLRFFIELDDDYTSFRFRFNSRFEYCSIRMVGTIDACFEALVEFMESTPTTTIALSQGGDHIGGSLCTQNETVSMLRKAMNSFVCDVNRPFMFVGKLNEDTNTYTLLGRQGALFFTVQQAQLDQLQTQSNPGGLTELYLDAGTYVKSFYSVIVAPSCMRVSTLASVESGTEGHHRIHHRRIVHHTQPEILRESLRKPEVTRG